MGNRVWKEDAIALIEMQREQHFHHSSINQSLAVVNSYQVDFLKTFRLHLRCSVLMSCHWQLDFYHRKILTSARIILDIEFGH